MARRARFSPSKTITVDMFGEDNLMEMLLRGSGTDVTKMAGRMMYRYANDVVFNASQDLVPVDTGALRSSGHVVAPYMHQGAISVAVRYGGAAAPYALWVHEDPYARHAAPTQFKYLETPLVQTIDAFKIEFRRAVKDFLLKGDER